MWIVCQANNSHEMSRLISLKSKIEIFFLECHLLLILLGTVRDKVSKYDIYGIYVFLFFFGNKSKKKYV